MTKAAVRLGIGQSAVSHMLDKLREITDDPLFVRSGRGIVATDRAQQLAVQIRPLLRDMHRLAVVPEFDPAKAEGVVAIGAAAMQRELLIPPLARVLREQAPLLDLKIINSGVQGGELLRSGRCDLIISPSVPQGTEFMVQKLFEDRWVCFYDPAFAAPLDMAQYVARPHAKVVFSDDEVSEIDRVLSAKGQSRRIALRVDSFSALSELMRGTEMVISLPQIIERSFMRRFASCGLPFELARLPFFMAWHMGQNLAPLHIWLRGQMRSVVRGLDL